MNIAKIAIDSIVALGVGSIVGNIVKSTTPGGLRLIEKTSIAIGSMVLGFAAGDIAAKWVNNTIDETVKDFKELKKKRMVEVSNAK